ncbi:spore coat protein YlbD [Alkalihalobacillus sp. AL-G]|uniref:spore coat protein YlbD n=1 Tax=Alkalihalobacillus sp. AL-G TaxID=2926399 RepID=UPI00272AC845|nr:spore coat protein YlbD [Alkalihalobacillus sp. AL-G]WLD95037.1 YlbD family protein [Alkalihalobacillus sp. AL-G]
MSKQARNNQKVEEFKMFVRSHPGLIDHVKSGNQTWKDVFTEWHLLGEEHDQWGQYKERKIEVSSKKKSKKSISMNDLSVGEVLTMIKNLDMEEVREYVSQFSTAVSGVQELLQQFQSPKHPGRPPAPNNPFNQYFKD